MFARALALQARMTRTALMNHLNVQDLLAVAGFTAQGSTGRCLRDVWFHQNPSACIDTIVRCAHLAAMLLLGRRFRRCRSTLMVSILESGSGVGANMHDAFGHCFTSHSSVRFASRAAH